MERGEKRSKARLAMELGVIFLGVLGAFFAEDLRQTREDDQRAQQIYQALVGELQAFTDRAPLVVDDMTSRLDAWGAAFDQGQRPVPAYYREPQAETPPTAIWEATLASGGVAVLDPALFNILARYYNRVGSVSDRYRRYNERTETLVLPRVGEDPATFYDPDGKVIGEYRAHMDLLAEIRDELATLSTEGIEVGDSLRSAIR